MKPLEQYIAEKLKIAKSKTKHTLFPESKEELIKMIAEEIKTNGNECSLNHIDVSGIDDMSYLFSDRHHNIMEFNGDISKWDVSNVTSMGGMFGYSKFDKDISEWDVSNVKDMSSMFLRSSYTGKDSGISKWDVSSVTNMNDMFAYSKFDGDLSKWNVSNVEDMESMFYRSNFTGKNGSLSNWNVSNVETMEYMFYITKFDGNLSNWKIKKDTITIDMFEKTPLENKKEFWPKSLQ